MNLKRTPNFEFHLRKKQIDLTFASLILLAQAVVTTLFPLPLMALIDGIFLSAYPQNASPDRFLYRVIVDGIQGIQTGLASQGFNLGSPLMILGGVVLTLMIVIGLLEYFERVVLTRASYSVVEGLREDLVSRLMTRRQGYLDRKRKSDLVGRLSTDAATLEYLITSTASSVAREVPTLLFLSTLLILLHAPLALLVLVVLPLSYYLTLIFSRSARISLAKVRSETQHFENETTRLLTSAPAVKSLTLENFALRSLLERMAEIGRHVIHLRQADGALFASVSGTRQFLSVLLLFLGGLAILNNQMTLGSLAVFLIAIGSLTRAVFAVAQYISEYGRSAVSLERIEALFRDLEGQEEQQGTQAFISLPFPDATTLTIEDVSFAYPESPFLFENISASFQAGELIALMGPSGSGRTTFGRLINRLLDPIEGRVLLGRTDIKRFRLDVLRTYVTVLDNDPFFIPGTVRENLLLGALSSEDRHQQISEALNAANAYDFVQGLPERLETIIGEGGYELSSSQQRRLSFVRALLRDESQIFVLDEPTSGLDPDSVSAVISAIHQLAEKGVMVFWITNRLEEIPLADRVVYFGRGRNPVIGTHVELVDADTTYRQYFTPTDLRPQRDRGAKPRSLN